MGKQPLFTAMFRIGVLALIVGISDEPDDALLCLGGTFAILASAIYEFTTALTPGKRVTPQAQSSAESRPR